MMMRNVMIALLVVFCTSAMAQEEREDSMATTVATVAAPAGISFGYFSYDAVLKDMKEYREAQATIKELRQQYENEASRSEQDFNLKYEEFLEGRASYPEAILQKRQAELQNLMERNVEFRKKAEQQLRDAEQKAMQPVHQRLQTAAKVVGTRMQLAFVLNTDNNACPFISPAMGVDVTEAIKKQVK